MALILIDPLDDCDTVVDTMLSTAYNEEFCIALDWEPEFVSRLMKAGFLIMSETMYVKDGDDGSEFQRDIMLPKLHLIRSALFFDKLHIKKSIKKFLSRYELCFDTDFDTIVHKCLKIHGDGWLTPSLIKTLFFIRKNRPNTDFYSVHTKPKLAAVSSPLPVSFSLYRNGELKAGEFGVISGSVYTSYSGYTEENNAGTVQMILMAHALEKAGFAFLDFGMPLDYKRDLGSLDISPKEFTGIFRLAQRKAV